tara:strand:+ start:132 stop:251 length:120 start_codon:yes stop_codon:yes gene_type:complete
MLKIAFYFRDFCAFWIKLNLLVKTKNPEKLLVWLYEKKI